MVYVTGNIHGDIERFKTSPITRLKRKDTLIVCGDFGFVWDYSKEEKKIRKWLGKRRYQILFVEGTHENFNDLATFPVAEFAGGKARILGKNLFQALRGEVYEIDGLKILALGGGSLDEDEEAVEGVNWLIGEEITEGDWANARQNIEKENGSVDFIVSHDPPLKIKEFLTMREGYHHGQNSIFDYVGDNCKFKIWYFGHYHIDQRVTNSFTAVYEGLHKLEKPEEEI